MKRRHSLQFLGGSLGLSTLAGATQAQLALTSSSSAQIDGQALLKSDWPTVLSAAKGQTVYFNAWAGDEKTNAFIQWVNREVSTRFDIKVQHVKLKDTAEAVTRVVAEKTAGRQNEGSVDLIWINGPNFLAMKQKGLLFGPFANRLPNFQYVDIEGKPSNLTDFTEPVQALASPWRLAKIVFIYDSARMKTTPQSMDELLVWAKANPGRTTHPNAKNFLGATFLKQALVEKAPDVSALQKPVTDAAFSQQTEKLWAWYQELRPNLWRAGRQFPENGPAQRQLLNDGEIDCYISFSPAEAAVLAHANQLPASARSFSFPKGTIGNTSFVAIPFNAAHKAAAMVVANFLLEPGTQAYAQDLRSIGALTVLNMNKISATQKARFDSQPKHPAMLSPQELGPVILEPHASWMTRLTSEWEKRLASR
jgi:putative thiamine transport system substrate-binding protein